MPETPDLIIPEEGATITITPQQLRKNGMLKVAATYHAPAEIKHVPLIGSEHSMSASNARLCL
eukprot:scaffold19239_cov23-Tisochrysis_lutea.AAC.1